MSDEEQDNAPVIDTLDEFIKAEDESVVRLKLLHDATALAKEKVRQHYTETPGAQKPYHNEKHIEDSERRGTTILHALDATEEEYALFSYINAFHDYDVTKGRGPSEEESALIATRLMTRINERAKKYGKEIFTKEHIDAVREGIKVTVPKYVRVAGYPEGATTVMQEDLAQAKYKTTLAMALADIGTPALQPHDSLKDGANLFYELNPTWQSEPLSSLYKKAQSWFANQEAFTYGRAQRIPREVDAIGIITNNEKQRLKNLFSNTNFLDAITLNKRKRQLIETLAPQDLPEQEKRDLLIAYIQADTEERVNELVAKAKSNDKF
jgi:hypothetical protein